MSFAMGAADALFEILQLGDHVPIAHALEPWRVRRLHAAPVGTVAARRRSHRRRDRSLAFLVTVGGAGLSGSVLM